MWSTLFTSPWGFQSSSIPVCCWKAMREMADGVFGGVFGVCGRGGGLICCNLGSRAYACCCRCESRGWTLNLWSQSKART